MAVVINDMEVAPRGTAPSESGQSQGAGSDSGAKDKIKQLERNLHKKQQRRHRLEAY